MVESVESVDVTADGAVLLGRDVACDGFIRDAKVRVQTHVHIDHMGEFSSSKGFQEIVASEGTHRLLCALGNADLPYRLNFRPLEFGVKQQFGESLVTLVANEHMLGSAQVAVELPSGIRVGYSGDFSWPLNDAIKVDVLVVDATYGSPESIREYSQAQAEEELVVLVKRALARSPVHILAHRGTLQRALQALDGQVDYPILASSRQIAEACVYKECGYVIGELIDWGSSEGRSVREEGRYIQIFGTGDRSPIEPGKATTIRCSAYMGRRDSPVLELTDRAFSVALTNHADFFGTLEYVRMTGARYCVTDNARGPHGASLAQELRARLGIKARVSSNRYDRAWGR